jgi:hypothetical protein
LNKVSLAVEALAAVNEGIHRDPVAGLEAPYFRPYLLHYAHKFVSHDHRRSDTGQRIRLLYGNKQRAVQVLFQVGSTDATPGYF